MKIPQCFKIVGVITLSLMLGSCSHDEVLKPAALVNFQPSVVVQKQWNNSVSMGNSAYLKMAPAFINNKIFIAGTSGKIKALDSNTGKTLWQTNAHTSLSSGLGANNNMLFVGTADGRILALLQQNGQIVWQTKVISDVLAAPAANDEIVVAKAENGMLGALRARDGKMLWNYTPQSPALILRGNSAPKIIGHQVICGFANGEMIAFDIDNGNMIWQQRVAVPSGSFLVERMVDIVADPVIDKAVVYVVAYQGSIAAINVKNGNIIWQQPLSSISGLSFDDKNIYVTDTTDKIIAFNKNSGHEIWKKDGLANRGLSGTAVLNGTVAVGDVTGYVHWFNAATGQLVARTKVNGGIITAPTVYNNALYIYSLTGSLTKFVK